MIFGSGDTYYVFLNERDELQVTTKLFQDLTGDKTISGVTLWQHGKNFYEVTLSKQKSRGEAGRNDSQGRA